MRNGAPPEGGAPYAACPPPDREDPVSDPTPSPAPPPPEPDTRPLAAVDLGSNSFHLVIARERGEEIAILDRVRDQVQLASGLGKKGALSKEARKRALACLHRFGQRLHAVPKARVRAVGTNTLRAARRNRGFLARAEAALGHPIEIVSGNEEGRLIYLGVSHNLPASPEARLVVDIGGGSTECILGEGFEATEAHSLKMGCVQMTRRYFRTGAITETALEEATLAAAQEFRSLARSYRDRGWDLAIGSSGTMRATEAVLRGQGWTESGITKRGLKKLRKAMLQAGDVRKLKLEGLKGSRAPVFPGGVAIILALFDRLKPDALSVSSGALREGVLYDLLGRIRHEDVRERTIRSFQRRYRVDTAQAERVERLALGLLSHAPESWALDPVEDGRFLAWAARLHEIGLAVSYGKYHRHGGYLLAHANMPGFSRDDQDILATVVRNHRRRIDPHAFEDLAEQSRERVARLVVLLRLAVLLCRSRNPAPLPAFRLSGSGRFLCLDAPRRWLEAHPLSVRDLRDEQKRLASAGFALELPL